MGLPARTRSALFHFNHPALLLTRALCLAALSVVQIAARAEDLPLWELGGGIGVLNFPEYRGSDERSSYVLPIPYIIYRGEVLKVDRESVRGRIFESDRVRLDVSLNGSIPVDSSDNEARAGLPDLDPTLELGPNLKVLLWRSDEKKAKLDFRLPVRAVVTAELDHVGWVTQPQINLDLRDPLGYPGWRLGLLSGPLYGDRGFHHYFYGVGSAYATADRPAFDARGGYSGSQFVVALSKRFPGFWVGGFAKWDTLDGAVFEDSPLVRDKSFATAGLAFAWVFRTSQTRVRVEDGANP